jgi:hypothetical protein
MDLFTEQYAHHMRDAVDLDIARATQLAPLVAVLTKRPRRRVARTVTWIRLTVRPTRRPTGTTQPAATPSSTRRAGATTAGT